MRGWSSLLFAVGLGPLAVLCGSNACSAETPEPLPSYADARSLREDASLHAVAFTNELIGLACGDRGTILRTEDGGKSWLLQDSSVDCRLDDVIWFSPQRAVIVGGGYDRVTQISRGVVLYSDDAGKHWNRADDAELPRLRAVRLLDHQSLLAVGDWSHSLLTRELESHDGGRSWHSGEAIDSSSTFPAPPTSAELRRWVDATGIPVPMRDACRLNDTDLCAVGDHGTILLSGDRGRSWRPAHGENRHTSILFVARDPTSVPWSLVGREAHENRNRVALLLHQTADSDRGGSAGAEVAGQVAVMMGGGGADMIASPQGDLTLAAIDWMVIHRPSVVVLDPSLPSDVRDAFFQAATSSGIRRIVDYSFDGRGNTALHSDALLPKSGVLASDLFADAMHYLAPHRSSTPSIALRYLYDVAPATRRGDSVASGIPLEMGQRLASTARQASRHQLQIVQARLRQSERIAALIRAGRTTGQIRESLASTLDQTAKEDQFRLAWSMLLDAVSLEANSTRIAYQEVALDLLASRFPATSAGQWAQLRREAIRHSLEWQRLRASVADTLTATRGTPAAEIVPVSPFQVASGSVKQVSAISPLVVPKPERHDLTRTAEAKEVEVDLTWEFHPLVLIAREAARQRGDDGELQVAEGDSANVKRLAEARHGSWSNLLQSRGPQVVVARRAESPPRLDGKLQDSCWLSRVPSTADPAPLRVAYDEDYVYVATTFDANELGPDSMAALTSPTARDQDLTAVDRMRLRIDTDRDLMTAMQLQVSTSGRTHDSIDGNPRWQPTWYVATERLGERVNIELAILRRDLADLPIPAGESWFLSAESIRAGNATEETILPMASNWSRVLFEP